MDEIRNTGTGNSLGPEVVDNGYLVDFYIMGVHAGKYRVEKDGLIGKLIQGQYAAALGKSKAMQDELDTITERQP